jgi:putative membrane protein
MKRLSIFFIICLFTLTFAQERNKETTQERNEETLNTDNKFVKEAASAGMMEVELGKLASDKASSNKVKEFAQLMVKDHSKANQELKEIALEQNLQFPDEMVDKHKEQVQKIQKNNQENFDKKFMNAMVEDHKKTIKKFKEASENNDNGQIRQWAENTLPTLEEHLQIAQSILKSLDQVSTDEQKQLD